MSRIGATSNSRVRKQFETSDLYQKSRAIISNETWHYFLLLVRHDILSYISYWKCLILEGKL